MSEGSARFDPSTPIILTGDYQTTIKIREAIEKPEEISRSNISPMISYILNPSLNISKQEAPSTASLPALW